MRPGESIPAYNARIASARGSTAEEFDDEEIDDAEDETPSSRLPGESIMDFTSRLDTRTTGASKISQQDYFLKPGEGIDAYNARIAGLRGESMDNEEEEAPAIPPPATTSPVVGTSAAERFKELQDELGIGEYPTAPDLFTNADSRTLNTARRERAAIDDEMAQILDERLSIDEELQKYSIAAGKGTTEAGRIGAVSEAERNANERLQVLNRRELVLETKLNNRNTVISELMGLQKEDYANAVAQYNSEFSKALQLYSIFDEEQDEVEANAKASLDVLSKAYQAQIESGKLSQLSGTQRAKLEELEVQAGLPIGSTMAVLQTLKPNEEKLWSGIDDFGNFVYISRDTNGQINVKKAASAVPQKDTSGSDNGLTGGKVKITAEDSRVLVGAGFSTAEITQIVADVNEYGIDSVLAGVSDPTQKKAIQKVFGVESKVTRIQLMQTVTLKMAQDGLRDAYTTQELEELASDNGFASVWKSKESEINDFLNSERAKALYVDLLYQQYDAAGQAE